MRNLLFLFSIVSLWTLKPFDLCCALENVCRQESMSGVSIGWQPCRQGNRRVGTLTAPAGSSGDGKVQGRNTMYGASFNLEKNTKEL